MEKTTGESSDSEVYLSADEGLTSSRGSEKAVAVPSLAGEEAVEGRSSDSERDVVTGGEREGESEGREGSKEDGTTPNGKRSPGREREHEQSSDIDTVASCEVERRCVEGERVGRGGCEGEGERGETGGDGTREEEEEEEEREVAPVPPPRRKRKKKLQKNPSLEDLEKLTDDMRKQRSMTVGSVDMSREKVTPASLTSLSPSPSPLPRSHTSPLTTESHTTSLRDTNSSPHLGARGGETPSSPRGATLIPDETEGTVGNSVRPSREKTAPSISIEPDGSLELTEEMMLGGSAVMTRDTLLAKAYGSDKHETEIIFDSDDESEGDGVYGSQELHPPDHSDSCTDGDTEPREAGQSSEVARGHERVESGKEGVRELKDKTPVAGEKQENSHLPSDNQILQMTIVKNLDTGDSFPLSVVDKKIPLGNPLNQHLYRRTAAMESHADEGSGEEGHHRRRPHLKIKLRHLLPKKRTVARAREGEGLPRGHVAGTQDPDTTIKYKPCSHHKGPYDFDRVRLRQDLTGPHLGAVWVMEFSICGRLLAVAGQDSIVRVWVLRTAAQFFHELQAKYQRFGVHSSGESLAEKASVASTTSSEEDDANSTKGPFLEVPLCMYHGHAADILDLSWSKNFFLLSSSMDKTVRLWHISRKECLCCFQHVDFVTAIAFHPRDDRYFLSGSLDGKLRLWNIPDKRVALWNEIEGVGSHLITAANFCMNGKLAVAGTYDGRCIFYETEHLKYHTQIHVRSRHGKNRGRKVSGIEPLPGEDKILVTTNDSRLRLYNLKDHSLSCKYKGGLNTSSQIRATFSRDGLNIICGSEDHFIYVWKTHHDFNKLSSVRRDLNEFYESFSTHHAPVTAAVFAPVPGITVDQGLKEVGQMIVAADYQGGIKVYVNSEKL